MGSSESKQAATRLQGANLSALKFPTETLLLRYQKSFSLKLQLCDEHSNPLCLVTLPNGWSGDLVLYSGLSKEDDAPLALVTGNKQVRGVHHTVRLAPAVPGGPVIQEELRMVGKGFIKVKVAYTFVLAVEDGSPRGLLLPEKFEWRGSKGEQVQSLGQRWHGWKLVRLGNKRSEGINKRRRWDIEEDGHEARTDDVDEEDDDDDDERGGEVVAVWADVNVTKSLHKAAMFKFMGSGASAGGLGDAFRAMAVVTFLRLWQLNSQNAAGAGDSSSAAVAVIAAGV